MTGVQTCALPICGSSNDNSTGSYAYMRSENAASPIHYFVLPLYNITNITVHAKTSYSGITGYNYNMNGYLYEKVYNYFSSSWNTLKSVTIVNTTSFSGVDSFSLSSGEWGVDNKVDFQLQASSFGYTNNPPQNMHKPIYFYETWVDYTYVAPPFCDVGLMVFPCTPPSSFNFTKDNVSVNFNQNFGDLFGTEISTNNVSWVAVDSGSVANVPATINFTGVPAGVIPYRNGVICGAECSNIVNDGNNLVFDVSGWSNYSYGPSACTDNNVLKLNVEMNISNHDSIKELLTNWNSYKKMKADKCHDYFNDFKNMVYFQIINDKEKIVTSSINEEIYPGKILITTKIGRAHV